MCLAIPVKITAIKNKKIIIKEAGQEKSASGSLIKTKVGDYVILQNNFVVRKIDKKSAKEIINLTKK
ncbi:MAG TPA: HypC/HybG/HupF family hydrogenase formation chaperone [Candidatus Nealsonbacteria bacterium]|uniref:HypC/HybG/HupF family hydrogenase formation chaperone n=1 Tax=marine sediment metagenome TaxID=412755 RepID=A0A0F9V1E4_9ZZZZ|nr:HypC/HybG/HupF family hydrogenase formation chaperone [Candidatus Nealsonbacteria bacterium]HEB46147.1 HypC/HybG/HupF family hydrogenase formation chaperone [Candidatus Nealsonbacteria bacterium]